ncbi:hypothetical protein E5S69_20465 [Cupriavidus necator]|uniref:hypothetical protein n=1 Tax=Cupriavidus necator TaxID=106590 RepID=UPI0014903149|nr:hypothetical protein [Cupriavidus necator]NOV25880.1 hypothetical protein [Cupriavidus necator]
MMEAIYAVVEQGTVTNVVVWDGVSEWNAPSGATVVPVEDGASVSIGYFFDGTSYREPRESTPG